MIVITGGTGVLGEFLLKTLSELGTDVVAIKRKPGKVTNSLPGVTWEDADLADPNRLCDVFQGASMVIHAAAQVSFNPRERDQIMQTNVEGTKHVVNACLATGVSRLLHVSSVAALGRQRGAGMIDEKSKWVESNLNSDYAESKYLAELEVFRGQEEGLAMDMVNPSIILAPSLTNRSSARIFHYVKKQPKFYSGGHLNYVDVRDVVSAIVKLMNANPTGQRYILNGGNIEIKRLLAEIARRFNVKAPSIQVPSLLLKTFATTERIRSAITGSSPLVTSQTLRGTRNHFHYDNTKATTALGLQFRDIEDTLDWCCGWYTNAYNKQTTPAS